MDECIQKQAWNFENGFYLTSPPSRLAKLLAHYELYKKISHLPGDIVECGVFKGASFMRWLGFRDLLETNATRRVIGFDTFTTFPHTTSANDNTWIDEWTADAGQPISVEALTEYINRKGFTNFELVKGNALITVSQFVKSHPERRIAILNLDMDAADVTTKALDELGDRVVPGGLILFDDYTSVEGGTVAADGWLRERGFQIQRPPLSSSPCFIHV